MIEESDQSGANSPQGTEISRVLKSGTLKLLYDVFADGFKQQSDLDESVRRSLPFIAVLFGFAISVISTASPRHQFSWSWPNIFYFLAIFAFCAAAFYVYVAVKIREFEYPAKTIETRDYAQKLTKWHADNKEHHTRIDAKVVDDLRWFMINQFANANETNQVNVRKRLLARSYAINIMLVGFLFISVREVIIFVSDQVPRLEPQQVPGAVLPAPSKPQAPSTPRPQPPEATPIAHSITY